MSKYCTNLKTDSGMEREKVQPLVVDSLHGFKNTSEVQSMPRFSYPNRKVGETCITYLHLRQNHHYDVSKQHFNAFKNTKTLSLEVATRCVRVFLKTIDVHVRIT